QEPRHHSERDASPPAAEPDAQVSQAEARFLSNGPCRQRRLESRLEIRSPPAMRTPRLEPNNHSASACSALPRTAPIALRLRLVCRSYSLRMTLMRSA